MAGTGLEPITKHRMVQCGFFWFLICSFESRWYHYVIHWWPSVQTHSDFCTVPLNDRWTIRERAACSPCRPMHLAVQLSNICIWGMNTVALGQTMAIGAGQQWALAMLIVIGMVSRFLIPTLLDNGPCCITTTYSAVVKRQK